MAGIRRVSDLGTQGVRTIADGSIFESELSTSAVTADKLANNSVTAGKLDSTIPLSGFRNAVINGSFDVWQRGTSISTSGSGITNYSADRWRFGNNGGASQFTISRVTNTSSAPCAYAMRLTSAQSANSLNGLEYCMEYLDVAKLWGKSLVLTFYVRSSSSISISTSIQAGTLTTDAYPGVGNGLTGSATLGSATTNVTTSWQKVTIPCSAVTSSYGQLRLTLLNGVSISSGIWIEFAGVQLEVGTQATPFEQRPVATELKLCQRYYEKSYDFNTVPATNTNNGLYLITSTSEVNGSIYTNIQFKVEKRNASYTPTIYSQTGTTAQWTYARSGASGNVSAFAIYQGTHGMGIYTASVGTAWVAVYGYGHWIVSNEL